MIIANLFEKWFGSNFEEKIIASAVELFGSKMMILRQQGMEVLQRDVIPTTTN